MKTLKLFIAVLLLSVAATAVKAEGTPKNRLSKDYAVFTYADAMAHGTLNGLNDVLDQNVTFSMVRGKKVESVNKADMLKFFKENKNISQNCTVETSVVDSSDDISVVKVDMHYTNFTRTNYVTVANTAAGWKITNVHSVFKS